MITQAQTLAEVQRLERILQSGKIPHELGGKLKDDEKEVEDVEMRG